jgi:DNA-binding MarR family transcriptional regulator
LSKLAHGEATESELRDLLELDRAVASRALSQLRMLGLIERATARSRYGLVLPDLTIELMRRASELAQAINERRVEADRSRLRELTG